jgi:threonine/homoserine/homoserine lactone efflux protein
MLDPLAYVIATLALLAAPGPTNTLLATSAAAAGALRSLPLALATALGYLIATLTVAFVLSPLAQASRSLDISLRVACGAYLMFAAWRLWREGGAPQTGEPVSFRRVLVATSLNPKGVIFASVVVPFLSPPQWDAAPYLAALAIMAVLVAIGWMAVGAGLRSGAGLDAAFARRAGASVLAAFALLVGGSALTV